MSLKESLIDEVFTLRNLLAREKKEHEQTRRELAMALDRLADLEDELESHHEAEDPDV